MKRTLIILVLVLIYSFEGSLAQVNRIDELVNSFSKSYYSADFRSAEKSLIQLLDPELKTQLNYLPYIYTNLGAISTLLGKDGDAVNYYNKAEAAIRTRSDTVQYLGEIYINKALLLDYNKSYGESIDFYEKGIRLIEKYSDEKPLANFNISEAYHNLGVLYNEINEYDRALDYSMKSYDLKIRFKLKGLPLVYFNIARCWAQKGDLAKAEGYYQKSVGSMISEEGPEYFRLPEIYFHYSKLLYTLNRKTDALGLLTKALEISRHYYGKKNSITAYSYMLLGDYYRNQAAADSALFYYQEALTSISEDFSYTDITTNPASDSSLYDIRLLQILKSKALTLQLQAAKQKDTEARKNTLSNSLGTIISALGVMDRIRSSYHDEESRIYLANNEKETLLSAIGIAGSLDDITGSRKLVEKMYSFAQKAKASVLQDEISENDIIHSPSVPDSLIGKLNTLSGNIEGHNMEIAEELSKKDRDSSKISRLKDEIFRMKRDAERVKAEIISIFPEFQNLLAKTEPLSSGKIREQLASGQTIIDYSLSNKSEEGRRKLYFFVISRDTIRFLKTEVDSVFSRDAAMIRNANFPATASAIQYESTRNYNEALFRMYSALFEPVRKLVNGKRIIIIPDEELAFLPFEAFLTKMPRRSERLHYLLNDYAISYAYSSSLIFSRSDTLLKDQKVLAFSPDYGKGFSGIKGVQKLNGAGEEIASIYKWFGGEAFSGSRATETNFRRMLVKPAIYHLAMHSVPDTLNSRFSFLLFDSLSDTAGDGKLYNYEISLLRIRSPMVVLSACNSGTGTLYHGEGLMSLARGFLLAGASSVIRTSWEVNDQTSSKIIGSFYKYLSRGMTKDKAMRLAKLDYIRSSPPAYAGPYYWAAYEVLGDTSPVAGRKNLLPVALIIAVIVAMVSGLLYFRRRRIVADRLPK